jgi:hypothetical protein
MSDLPDIQTAVSALGGACERVALSLQDVSKFDPPPPPSALLWLGTYAAVMLCPINDPLGLRRAEAEAEAWMAELLEKCERSGHQRVIDGYLVLALPNVPTGNLEDEVRRIELSSQVCRKHVIWPALSTDARESGWLRLEAVTATALPQGVTAATGPVWPELTDEADALWQKISVLGPVAAAADETPPS